MPAPLFHRRPGGLLWYWTLGLALVGVVYWIIRTVPAFSDLLTPFYWVIALTLVILTIRWFRPRATQRRHEERRSGDRRDDTDEPPPAA